MITSAIVSTGKVLITSNSYNILNSSDNQDLMTSINNASTEGVVITSNSKNILNDIIIITVSIVTILLFIVLITFISLLLIFKHCRNLNAKKNDVRYEESLQANDNQPQGNFYDLDLSEENRFSEVLDYPMYESVNNHRRDSENMDYVDMTGSVHSEYFSKINIYTDQIEVTTNDEPNTNNSIADPKREYKVDSVYSLYSEVDREEIAKLQGKKSDHGATHNNRHDIESFIDTKEPEYAQVKSTKPEMRHITENNSDNNNIRADDSKVPAESENYPQTCLINSK